MFYMDLMALTTMETLLQQSRFWNQSKNMSEASIKVQLEVSMYPLYHLSLSIYRMQILFHFSIVWSNSAYKELGIYFFIF